MDGWMVLMSHCGFWVVQLEASAHWRSSFELGYNSFFSCSRHPFESHFVKPMIVVVYNSSHMSTVSPHSAFIMRNWQPPESKSPTGKQVRLQWWFRRECYLRKNAHSKSEALDYFQKPFGIRMLWMVPSQPWNSRNNQDIHELVRWPLGPPIESHI